ncbi:MAG: helix-turn-helix transcriptional regulator [Clostridiales bacterium]|nr:helix-turn-helix transcriptional regulator [Clostridiales bacterium]MBS5877526.1 helix-turn-helix transcriptional regulator [Clostridiales bacterium]MDU3490048.1 helix-turn-helix transcriptional regulator [Clostridiales bacterium]
MKFPNIEAERARLGLTKTELSDVLGVTTKTYYGWLNGVSPIPSTVLIKLSDMSNKTIDYLLSRAEILSASKLEKVLHKYKQYHQKNEIDENKIVYLDRQEILELNCQI